jgi:hypothetical protein
MDTILTLLKVSTNRDKIISLLRHHWLEAAPSSSPASLT